MAKATLPKDNIQLGLVTGSEDQPVTVKVGAWQDSGIQGLEEQKVLNLDPKADSSM